MLRVDMRPEDEEVAFVVVGPAVLAPQRPERRQREREKAERDEDANGVPGRYSQSGVSVPARAPIAKNRAA